MRVLPCLVRKRGLANAPQFESRLTFDDVLLEPNLSTVVSRKQVSLKTQLSRNIVLNNPIVSSNMDTVTEAKMAIAMAKAGGIGFLHRYLSVEEQVAQVRSVKRAEAFIISDPYTISRTATVGQLRALTRERGVKSTLVTEADGALCGIVTNRDLRFSNDQDAALVADVMTPKSRLKVATLEAGQTLTPDEAKALLQQYRLEKLPLVDKEWRIRGLITSRDLYHYLNNPFSSHDRNHQLLVGAAIGVKSGDLDRALRLVEAGVDCLVVDVAHGHSQLCMDQVRLLRRSLGDAVDIIAGNVATGRGALALVECGADAIKVGVGPGSICTTRIVTGCGVPQLSAILDVAAVLNPLKIPFIADGGIK